MEAATLIPKMGNLKNELHSFCVETPSLTAPLRYLDLRMKEFVKHALKTLQMAWFAPLLILYGLSDRRSLIIADVERWAKLLSWPNSSPQTTLLRLFSECPEFRNLYYYRLEQGSLGVRLGMQVLKVFYPGCATLFIDRTCNIGPGLFLQHAFSTIIMADLGENCWINQQVTIGYRDKSSRPWIGDNVRITAGAKVIGGVKIGNNVTVGANAVVVKNVPDDCVVVGVPAYIVRRNGVKVKEELV